MRTFHNIVVYRVFHLEVVAKVKLFTNIFIQVNNKATKVETTQVSYSILTTLRTPKHYVYLPNLGINSVYVIGIGLLTRMCFILYVS